MKDVDLTAGIASRSVRRGASRKAAGYFHFSGQVEIQVGMIFAGFSGRFAENDFFL